MYGRDITHRCVGVDPPRAAPGLPIPPTLLLLRWRAAERALVSDEDCEDDDQEDEDDLDAKPFLPHLLLLTQRCYFGDLALFLDEDDDDDEEEEDQEDEDNLDAKPFLPHLLLLTQETWPFSWMRMMMMMRRRIVMKMTMVMTLLFLHGVATVLLLQ